MVLKLISKICRINASNLPFVECGAIHMISCPKGIGKGEFGLDCFQTRVK